MNMIGEIYRWQYWDDARGGAWAWYGLPQSALVEAAFLNVFNFYRNKPVRLQFNVPVYVGWLVCVCVCVVQRPSKSWLMMSLE